MDVNTEQSREKAFRWQRCGFFLSLVFLIAALLYAAGGVVCSRQGEVRVSLFFESHEHDFGMVSSEDSPKHQYAFVNRGRSPIVIQNVAPGCGSCVRVVDYTRSAVPSGGRGYVTLQLQEGLPTGKTSQTAIVTSNEPLSPALLLILNAQISASSDEVKKEK